MTNFECSVKDLMAAPETNSVDDVISSGIEHNKTVDEPVSIETPKNINLSLYKKLYTDKNIKTVIFITLIYLILNSGQFYTFLSNTVPILFIEGSPGLLGKTAIGIILSFVIILFTSFFSL
mgnify:CR=1 FL=1|tara:strand:+ start:433 stop:795 length:363 start_codon:yes stop_codon:yes gene_type:complete